MVVMTEGKDNAGHNKEVVELARKLLGKWSGEKTVEEVQQKADALAREDEDKVSLEIKQFPAITFLEGRLPRTMLDELNAHVDEHREKMADYSGNLVGQIKQTEKSQQLSLDRSHPTVQGLMNLLGSAGRAFLKSYSNQIPLEGGADGFDKAPIDCFSMWTVHSYEGDYNPVHDHGTRTPMGLSMILYLKVPPQISELDNPSEQFGGLNQSSGAVDGFTYLVWGVNGMRDINILRPITEEYIKPEVGTMLMFPAWLRHGVNPFFGEGERRTMSANLNIAPKEKVTGDHYRKDREGLE